MSTDSDKPEADVAEQAESADGDPNEAFITLADSSDARPVADMLEQSIPVRDVQVLIPAGNRSEASEADWIEQSIEVPLDEEEVDH